MCCAFSLVRRTSSSSSSHICTRSCIWSSCHWCVLVSRLKTKYSLMILEWLPLWAEISANKLFEYCQTFESHCQWTPFLVIQEHVELNSPWNLNRVCTAVWATRLCCFLWNTNIIHLVSAPRADEETAAELENLRLLLHNLCSQHQNLYSNK